MTTPVDPVEASSAAAEPERGQKRTNTENPAPEGIRELFISNIPYNVSQAGVTSALKRIFAKQAGFLGVKKVTTDRGFATVEFETPADAEAAVDGIKEVKLGPRTLNIKLNDPHGSKMRRIERESRNNEQRCESLGHDTAPNPECWFCLANPDGDKHLIYGVDPSAEVYLSLSKGPITPLHSFVCPVTHYGCFVQASDAVKNTCVDLCSQMSNAVAGASMETLIYERWIPMNSSAANHMQIHIVPIDKSKNDSIDWAQVLKDKSRDTGVEFIRVKDHFEVSAKLTGILNRVSYLYFSFNVGDKRENWLGIGKLGFTFPREVVCAGLGCPDRVDWKACISSVDTEKNDVERLRSLYYPS